MAELTKQQIGRCGELLVQYVLLKHGVESALLTTDQGVDLVAFHSKTQKAVTIQVKTSTHRGPADDKHLLWEIPEGCPADYIAAVDLSRNKFWLISVEEFKLRAPHCAKGRLRLWWPLPECEYGRAPRREEQFKEYEMDTAIPKVFGH